MPLTSPNTAKIPVGIITSCRSAITATIPYLNDDKLRALRDFDAEIFLKAKAMYKIIIKAAKITAIKALLLKSLPIVGPIESNLFYSGSKESNRKAFKIFWCVSSFTSLNRNI